MLLVVFSDVISSRVIFGGEKGPIHRPMKSARYYFRNTYQLMKSVGYCSFRFIELLKTDHLINIVITSNGVYYPFAEDSGSRVVCYSDIFGTGLDSLCTNRFVFVLGAPLYDSKKHLIIIYR